MRSAASSQVRTDALARVSEMFLHACGERGHGAGRVTVRHDGARRHLRPPPWGGSSASPTYSPHYSLGSLGDLAINKRQGIDQMATDQAYL